MNVNNINFSFMLLNLRIRRQSSKLKLNIRQVETRKFVNKEITRIISA